MNSKDISNIVIPAFPLPKERPYSWRALWILCALQIFGNLISIPLLKATNVSSGSISHWVLYSAISIIFIGIALVLAQKSGLGAPLLEGLIKKGDIYPWIYKISALSLFIAILTCVPILLLNLKANPNEIPAIWKLILASVDAGIQEEIFYRFFLMTLVVWLGGHMWQDKNGYPSKSVIHAAIILSALIFAWAHIDDKIANPALNASPAAYFWVLLVNTLIGITLGLLYWKQGLECAILTHFLIDAIGIGIVVPVYQTSNLGVQIILFVALFLTGFGSWRILKQIR